MTCRQCGAQMVKQRGDRVYLSNPPQWDERWWCACGYTTGWERVIGKTPEENLKEDWEELNRE